MPPQTFLSLYEPSVDFTRLDEPSVDFMRLEEPLGDHWFSLVLTSGAPETRSNEVAPFPKTLGPDNTVGPVPKISGYVFKTLQTNSAAHVPNTTMNPLNEDTHFCDLNLYETKFQNWCIIDQINSMTPDTKDFGVAPPNADTFSAASTPSKNLSFTGSENSTVPEETNNRIKFTCFTGSNLESTLEQGLPNNKDCRGNSKIYNFTLVLALWMDSGWKLGLWKEAGRKLGLRYALRYT